MDREIKFRAWDHFNQTMWHQNGLGNFFTSMERFAAEGNKITLMQYTGLKDKNGKEIFEEDIVYLKTNYHSRDKRFGWQYLRIMFDNLRWIGVNSLGHEYDLIEETDEVSYLWEIKGNIYENPNLLQNG